MKYNKNYSFIFSPEKMEETCRTINIDLSTLEVKYLIWNNWGNNSDEDIKESIKMLISEAISDYYHNFSAE